MFNLINQMSFTYNGGVSDFRCDGGPATVSIHALDSCTVSAWGTGGVLSESLFCFVSSDFVVRLPVNVPHVGQVSVQVHWLVPTLRLQSRSHHLLFALLLGVRFVRAHVASRLLHWRGEVRRRLVAVVVRLRHVVARLLSPASARLSHIEVAVVVHSHARRSQELAEALSVSCNSLCWLSKRQAVPVHIVSPHAAQVHDSLLATGAVDRPHILLGEHGVVLDGRALLCLELLHQFVQLFQSLLELSELLPRAFLVGKHVLEVGHQLVELVHQVCLQVGEVMQRGLVVKLILNFVKLLLEEFEGVNASN